MRSVLASGLILALSFAVIAEEKRPDPDRYGKAIVALFKTFHSSDDMVSALKDQCSTVDRRALDKYLKVHSKPALPTITLRNHDIALNFGDQIVVVHVVDARRGVFLFRGQEMDLGRPIAEMLEQIDRILSDEEAGIVDHILPRVFAEDQNSKSIAILTAEEYTGKVDTSAEIHDALFAMQYLEQLCAEMKQKKKDKSSSNDYSAFGDKINDELKSKPRSRPGISGWLPKTLGYIRAAEKKYCNDPSFAARIGRLLVTEYSITVDGICDSARSAESCLGGIKHPSPIYLEYGRVLDRWLKALQVNDDSLPPVVDERTVTK